MDTLYNDSKAKRSRSNFLGGSLLVIEDSKDHWLLIQRGLQTILPEVKLIWVTTAQEATDYLQDRIDKQLSLPRLVILDLYLPSREVGFGLLKSIKTSSLRQMPIIIISSSNHQDDIGLAYESGASSYFTKPIQPIEWSTYFQTIFDYWDQTVTLPNSRIR